MTSDMDRSRLPSSSSFSSSSSTLPKPTPKKLLLVLIDGIGDVTLSPSTSASLSTPLSLARIPVLDSIACAGCNGVLDPVEPGLACGSDTAHLSLFGYDPRVVYRGRGAFESRGAGLERGAGDIAFKSNFASIDEETGIVVRRRVDRSFEEEGEVLSGALDGLGVEVGGRGYKVSCRYATEHRCGVVVRGEGLCDEVEGTDPLKDGLGLRESRGCEEECDRDVECGEQSEDAIERRERREHTARVVNAVSDAMRDVLRHHPLNMERIRQGKLPANVVLLRGCGSLLELETFRERHGLRGCMVAPTKIIAGLGKSVGMEVLEVAGATGDYRSDFRAKAARMVRALTNRPDEGESDVSDTYDFGFLHIKAVDDASHDRDMPLKVACLEVVDAMVGQLVRALRDAGADDVVLGITGDHSTPVEFGDHSHEPVPVVMSTVRDVVEVISDAVLDEVSLKALPLPEELLGMTSDDRIDAFFSWKRGFDTGRATKHDTVAALSELDGAKGCLGRFPGHLLVPTMKLLG